jgi:hypothetical protein
LIQVKLAITRIENSRLKIILVIAFFLNFKYKIMKKTIRILGVTASFILMLSLTGCYYDEVVEQVIPPNNDVSFANDIQPIFNSNCVSCHPTIAEPDLTAGNSYNALINLPGSIVPFDAEASELMEMLRHDPTSDNPMPPQGPMATININLVEAWINQGALNN